MITPSVSGYKFIFDQKWTLEALKVVGEENPWGWNTTEDGFRECCCILNGMRNFSDRPKRFNIKGEELEKFIDLK